MPKGKSKAVPFDEDGIASLPNDKPAVYKIRDKDGENIYTGVAKRGRVRERLSEHLRGGPEPIRGGATVQVEQYSSIGEAEKTEERVIAGTHPKYNKRGK